MKNRFLLLLLALACRAFAQQTDSLLHEVTVIEDRYLWLKTVQFSVTPDSIQKLLPPLATAADWLPQESSVHVRQYAPGMVASYSTHGATSAQNTVLWGGIPINSAATGLTDLALLPTSLFSPVFLRGGSSAQFGSGAMGSVLALQNVQPDAGWNCVINGQVGSFNTLSTGSELTYASPKFTSQTRFVRATSENNYTFKNRYRAGQPKDTMQGAAYLIWHVSQLFEWKLNPHQRLDAEVWYSFADRESPINILVNAPSQAKLKDENWRARTGWHFAKNKHKADVGYAFLHEWERYANPLVTDIAGKPTDDTNRTVSQIARADYVFAATKNWFWQNGLQYRFDKVSGSNRIGTQHTSSAQTGLLFKRNHLEAQANLRAEWWNDRFLPLSPFASLKVPVFGGLNFTAFGGYNYRVPSMNDRFWVPGGNPDLLPESGWSYEVAANYLRQFGRFGLNLRAAYYRSNITNLIQWLPGIGSIWSPENVKQVRMQGFDFNAELSYQKGNHFFRLRGSWSFNQSHVLHAYQVNDQSVGKQLIYQPQIKGVHSIQYVYKSLTAQLTHRFVGEVFTHYGTVGNTLPAYNLFDVGLTHPLKNRWITCIIGLNLNNITNTYYENISFFPMPGVNYQISITFQL